MRNRAHQIRRAREAIAARDTGLPDLLAGSAPAAPTTRALRTARGAIEVTVAPPRSVETMRGVLVDLTPMRAAVGRLRQSEHLNRSVIAALEEGVVVFDRAGVARSCNASAERILGLGAADIVGHRLPFAGPQRIAPAGDPGGELDLGEDHNGVLTSLLHPDREPAWLSWNVRGLFRDDEREPYGIVATVADVTEREATAERLREERDRAHHLAYHDGLTGLPNRTALEEHLRVAIARARRAGRAVALLYFDLDNFKLINDSLGHAAGDEALQAAAQRLRAATRANDVLARQGGDEFLLLLSDLDADGAEVAAMVSRAVSGALEEPFEVGEAEFRLSASIGISLFPGDAADADGLLQAADAAMCQAKRAGKGGHAYYEADRTDHRRRLALTSRLRRALEADELELHYQPIVALDGGGLRGAEALLRWRDPERGTISPAEFIPIAEESGLIAPIGEWVIETVCAQLATWNAEGLRPRLSFNVSAREIDRDGLVPRVLGAVERHGVDPGDLCVELTESAVMSHPERTATMLAALHEAGLVLAIDDFGTGHSSLTRLRELPFDILKIDRSFLSEVPQRADAGAIVAAVLSLAAALGMRTVAEGVETPEQLAFLVAHDCPWVQGFHLARPAPAADLRARMLGARATV